MLLESSLPDISRCDVARDISTHVEKTHKHAGKDGQTERHLHACGEDCDDSFFFSLDVETSPRAWRKLLSLSNAAFTYRDISAYAEKTFIRNTPHTLVAGHLQIRGENVSLPRTARFLEGTSPCAWRKFVRIRSVSPFRVGHLRVCGENWRKLLRTGQWNGKSPDMWRRHSPSIHGITITGDISTYVEKTCIS